MRPGPDRQRPGGPVRRARLCRRCVAWRHGFHVNHCLAPRRPPAGRQPGPERSGFAADPMTVVYILDEASPGMRPLGGATKWWLHHSLSELAAGLEAEGSRLLLRRGAPPTSSGSWRGRPVPGRSIGTAATAARTRVDAGIKDWAAGPGHDATSFQANLMFEPWTVRTGAGGPYKVFTPFWRACLRRPEPRLPLTPRSASRPRPRTPRGVPAGDPLDSWGLLPRRPDWSAGLARAPGSPGKPGPTGGLRISSTARPRSTAPARDIPGVEGTSRLSAHLRFGEISPFRIWHALREHYGPRRSGRRRDLPLRTRLAGVLLAAAL